MNILNRIKEDSTRTLSILLISITCALPVILSPAAANNTYTSAWDKAWRVESQKPAKQRLSPAKLIARLAREKNISQADLKRELAAAGRIKVQKARDTRNAKRQKAEEARLTRHKAGTAMVRKAREQANLTPKQQEDLQFYTSLNRKVKAGTLSLAQQQLALLGRYNINQQAALAGVTPSASPQQVAQAPVPESFNWLALTNTTSSLPAPVGSQGQVAPSTASNMVPISSAALATYQGSLPPGKVWLVTNFDTSRWGIPPTRSS